MHSWQDAFARALARGLRVGVLALVITSLQTPVAWACKIKQLPDQFSAASSSSPDSAPPSPPNVAGVAVTRAGHAPPGNGDCSEVGYLEIKLQAGDSGTWPATLGVGLSLVAGTLPTAFPVMPDYPLAPIQGSLYFAGQDDPSQSIDFTLRAVAVDGAGTESTPVDIRVFSPGNGGGGCSLLAHAPSPGPFPCILSIGFLLGAGLRARSGAGRFR